jgi:hypothetical protein
MFQIAQKTMKPKAGGHKDLRKQQLFKNDKRTFQH